MTQQWQDELDVFMKALEDALNDLNRAGPYNTALAVQKAKQAVLDFRKGEPVHG